MTDKEVALPDTKRRILEVSRALFSKHGYEGTSIRKIAQESGVNVAAVNYHFKSKETLFWEIIQDAHVQTQKVVEEALQKTSTVLEMAMYIYDHFQAQGDAVRNTMKLFLSFDMEPPKKPEIMDLGENNYGPPGGEFIAQRLQQEIPFRFSEENLLWGVKAIFGCLIHWSMMCSAAKVKQAACPNPSLSPRQIRHDVERMISAAVEYIRNHPEIFDAK